MKGLALALLASMPLCPVATAAEDAPPARRRTSYVPVVQAEGLSRREQLMLTESLQKAIERSTTMKVVGSPVGADLIFQGDVQQSPK
jgi:hypothetical protein